MVTAATTMANLRRSRFPLPRVISLLLVCCIASAVNKSKSPTKPVIRATTSEMLILAEGVYDSSGRLTALKGTTVNSMEWIAQRFHYDYEIVRFYNKSFIGSSIVTGNLVNGTWTGLMGDITTNVADIALAAFGGRAAYLPYADLTYPFAELTYSMYVPFPEERNTSWAFLKPYSLSVWLLLVLSIVCMAIVISFKTSVRRKETKIKGNSFSVGTIVLYLVAVLTGQGGDWHYKGKSLVILGIAWSLLAVVIVNAYNGLLVSSLTTSKREPLVSSIQELVKKPHVPFYIIQSTALAFDIQTAESGFYKVLGDVVRMHPDRLAPTVEYCFDKVLQGSAVCFMESNVGEVYVSLYRKRTGKCAISWVDKGFKKYFYSFAMTKGNPTFPSVNQAITEIGALGLHPRWIKEYLPRGYNCEFQTTTTTNAKPISLRSLSDLFLLLAMGYSLVSVVFTAEHVHYRLVYGKCGRRPKFVPNLKPNQAD